jgi:hypothetical protein
MTDQPITTVADLLARLAAARVAGDGDLARSLVDLGSLWAVEADLDVEFAHDGIYWDAPSKAEVAEADALAKKARADLSALITDAAIKAEYREELRGQHYQAMRTERIREPALGEDDYG